MLLSTVLLILVAITSDRVYIIDENRNHDEKWYLGFGQSFKFSNGSESTIKLGKDLMINNSSSRLKIKSITYSQYQWLGNNETQIVLDVPPFTPFYFDKKISWWFQEPPETIMVKSNASGTITKYYVTVSN